MSLIKEIRNLLLSLAIGAIFDILLPPVNRLLISLGIGVSVWTISKLATLTSEEAKSIIFWTLAMVSGIASVLGGTWIFYGYTTSPMVTGIPFQGWGMSMIVLSLLGLSSRKRRRYAW
jgi:hypothetical protein